MLIGMATMQLRPFSSSMQHNTLGLLSMVLPLYGAALPYALLWACRSRKHPVLGESWAA